MPKKRTGTITKEQALKQFHDYYNKRHSHAKPITRLRAKMFDMMYQKKSKFVLKPGEPGSEKYMLEEGPRTFDMEGVDYFPEGTNIDLKSDNYDVSFESKGATSYDKEKDQNDSDLSDSPSTDSKIYGPRLSSGRLYSKHFKDVYDERFLKDSGKGSLDGSHLVKKYWEKYRDDKIKYARKNKKGLKSLDMDNNYAKFNYKEEFYYIDKDLNIIKNGKHLGNVLDESLEDLFNYLQGEEYIYTDTDGETHLVRNIWQTFKHPHDEDSIIRVYFDKDNIKVFFYAGDKEIGSELLETFLENIGIDFDEFLQYKIDDNIDDLDIESLDSESSLDEDEIREKTKREHCFDCSVKDPDCETKDCENCDYCGDQDLQQSLTSTTSSTNSPRQSPTKSSTSSIDFDALDELDRLEFLSEEDSGDEEDSPAVSGDEEDSPAVSGDEVLYEGDIELSNVENINMTGEEVDTLRAALNPTENYEGLTLDNLLGLL